MATTQTKTQTKTNPKTNPRPRTQANPKTAAPDVPSVDVAQVHAQPLRTRGGHPAPDQLEITLEDGSRLFTSYTRKVALVTAEGQTWLDSCYWNYSRTTSRYRNEFLGLSTPEIMRGLESGALKLTNLNR
jgi:hypothetical protein